MAKILRNGQVWSQTSYYKDIEEKPTINGHELLETNNTSASLEIFTNITKAEYEDPDFVPNYQTIYAVHDEEGNFRIHFWNQTEDPIELEPEEYILEDYREVLELPSDEKADSTVLYYLKEDWTNPDTDVLYKKGLWGWVDISEDPAVQEFTWILFTQSPVDDKTIYINELGEASTQVGGYLLDDVDTTKVMVVNNQDAFEIQFDEETKFNTIKFPYSNYNAYTPNTTYKITFTYADQMPKIFEYDSKLLDGIMIGEFGKLTFTNEYLYVVLDSTIYNSINLEDYNLTVEWLKPEDVSAINPLFFPVDESLTINNKGELSVGSVKNGWQSIHKIEDYLYQTYFSGMDYFFAEEYFKSMNTTAGFCSTVRSGNFIGRNHDQIYSELAEFIVETPNRTGRYATIGIAGGIKELTKEKVESGDYVKASRVVPFMVFDGMNEKGVVASINKVPCDKEPTTITEPDIEVKKTLCGYQLPRFILDNFDTAREGAEFIRDYVAVYMTDALQEEGYELNLMISDKDESFIIEFINNKNNLMNAIAAPYSTNFYVTDMTPNIDRSVYTPADVPTHTPSVDNNITEHGKGLERYNLINRSINPLTPYTAVAQMRLLMHQLYYTNTYEGIGGAEPWLSEFTGVGDITVDTPAADIMANTEVQDIIIKYANRSRDPLDGDYGTMHTSHTAIYDVVNKTVIISVQEGTTEYMFALPQEEGVDGELFIGPISDVSIDSSQNAILQTILDGIFNENKAYVLNYNNQEKLLTSATTLYDDYGAYLPFSGVIHNSYTLLRVYYDEPTKLVMGAKRYDITPVRYQLDDIPEGSPLATNCAVCVCDDYRKITFSSPDPFHVGTVMGWKGDGGVQYSYNKKDWFDWDGVTVLDANVRNMYGVYDIHFRGVENTYLYKSETEYTAFKVTMDESVADKHNVEVRGNCVYMLDFNTDVPETLDNIFRKLFSGGAALEQSKSLVLPFTSLGNHSYQDMFKGCSYLTNCPQIPAIETKIESCDGMFDGCTNLIEPPTLPATVLGEGCYRNMFRNCASITEAPLLEAMVLSEWCYEGMFEGCISLEQCPDLPAVMLPIPKGAYKNMFKNCKAITETPALDAVLISDESYFGMFNGCAKLVTTPKKFGAMTLGESCYEAMFANCPALLDIPELPAKILKKRSYAQMFMNCTGLTVIDPLPFETVDVECCREMFKGCTKLEEPMDLKPLKLAEGCYRSMFENCTGMKWYNSGYTYKIPCTGIGTSAANALSDMFKGTKAGITSAQIPEGTGVPKINTVYYSKPKEDQWITYTQPANNENASYTLTYLGPGVGNILYSTDKKTWKELAINGTVTINQPDTYIVGRTIGTDINNDHRIKATAGTKNHKVSGDVKYLCSIHPDDWAAAIPPDFCLRGMFGYSDYLVDASELILVDGYTSTQSYRGMFYTCTVLTKIPASPKIDVAATYAFFDMFAKCTLITDASKWELPAKELGDHCYGNMFGGCTNLVKPPLEVSGSMDSNSTYACASMFYQCAALSYTPRLPSTTTAAYCYYRMFSGCTTLKECMEELPALEMSNYCYQEMFDGCKLLQKAPLLPATTLAEGCYWSMFKNCELMELPEETTTNAVFTLPALTMYTDCYRYMFQNCKKIKKCPELPSTSLANNCYRGMFSGCRLIKRPVKLKATKMFQGCYQDMYNGCSGIKWFQKFGEPYRIPTTGTGTTATDWNTNMFSGNTPMGGATLPGGTTGSPAINTNYYLAPIEWVTFSAPTKFTVARRASDTTLTTVYSLDKEDWFDMKTSTITSNNQNELYVCSTESTPFVLTGGDNKIKVSGKAGCISTSHVCVNTGVTIDRTIFYQCTPLYDASEFKLEFLNGNLPVNASWAGLFYECTNLKYPPVIPKLENYDQAYGFYRMFYKCTSLEKAPEFEAIIKDGSTNRGFMNAMFQECTALKEIPKFKTNEVLYPEQLSYTFCGCTSLEKAPAMKITGVRGGSNFHMDGTFKNCSKLSDVTELDMAGMHFTKNDGNPTECLRDTFNGCKALKKSVLICQNNDTNYIPKYCFAGTFRNSGVEDIITIKTSHDTVSIQPYCFYYMYAECQNLTTQIRGIYLLDSYWRWNMQGHTFDRAFTGCKNLIYAPILCLQASGENATKQGYDYQCAFQSCVNLQNVPMKMFANGGNPGTYTYSWIFNHTSLPYPVTLQGGTYTVSGTSYKAAANSFNAVTADAVEKPWAAAYENGKTDSYQSYAELTNGYYMGSVPTDTTTYSNYALNGRGNNVPTNGWNTINPFYYRTPVKFVAPAEFTTYLPPNFCYSTDWFEWKVNSGTTKLAVTSGTENGKSVLWVKYGGVNRTWPGAVETYLESEAITQIGGNNAIRVFGNLSGLCGESGTCQCLFYNNKALHDVSGLNCGQMVGGNKYRAMFMGCSSLEHPMPLEQKNCSWVNMFFNMYTNCTALKVPASFTDDNSVSTMEAANVCREMYKGCTSLLYVPQIPFTTFGARALKDMFMDCKSLKYPSWVPSNSISKFATDTCSGMFRNCTGIIWSTTTERNKGNAVRYQIDQMPSASTDMFEGTTAVGTSIPTSTGTYYVTVGKPGTGLCISGSSNFTIKTTSGIMIYSLDGVNWSNCASGSSITTTNNKIYFKSMGHRNYRKNPMFTFTSGSNLKLSGDVQSWMYNIPCCAFAFQNATAISDASGLIFPDHTSPSCYDNMFVGCSNLSKYPALPASYVEHWAYRNIFNGTSSTTLTSMPSVTIGAASIEGMYRNNTKLKSAAGFPQIADGVIPYYGAANIFDGCTGLTAVPDWSNICDIGPYSLYYAFYNCANITTGFSLENVKIYPYNCCYFMYRNCTKLKQPVKLGTVRWLGKSCFQSMYNGCTGMVFASSGTAWNIPLGNWNNVINTDCVYQMFVGCSGTLPVYHGWTGTPMLSWTYYFSS